ncbi:MAG: AMP-binding protein [Bdellovibrionota bacterium]
MSSLHNTIFSLCEKRGLHPAYSIQKESGGYRDLTSADVRDQALRFSSYLASQGVGPGDRVLLCSENGPEWPIAALAVFNLRAVLVPVASIGSNLEIENTLKSARPKFCIYSRDIPGTRHLDELVKAENVGHLSWHIQSEKPLDEWIRDQKPAVVDATAGENDVAVLIYTSGTTGTPKGVPISHGNVLSNARAVTQVLRVGEKDRVVSVLPLSHMLEFTGGFVLATLAGAHVTYIKGLKPEDLMRALRDKKATALIAVPLLYEVISRNLQATLDSLPAPFTALFGKFAEWTRANPSLGRIFFFPVHRALGGNIRFLVAGGSRLHPQTFDYFKGLGITLLQGYGLTETSPVLTFTTFDNAAPDHVGQALPGIEVGIFNDKNERLPAGQEGEIWAKGPNVFAGYLDPEHSKGAFHDGWFRTGDLGNLDAQGLLRITGRKKDIIVTPAGKNVYPEEIEGLILADPHFLEAAALGLKDSSGHEKIALVVVPDRSRFVGKNQDEIRKIVTEFAVQITRALAEYKWPQKIEVFFEELPKTSTRKVKKHELRKLLETKAERKDTAASGGATLNLSNSLEGTIAKGIAEITKADPAKIRLADSLSKDLGLDSLTFVELVGQVEKKFGTRIEGIDFATILTVQDLVSALQFTTASKKRFTLFSKVFFADFAPRANQGVLWKIPRRIFNAILRVNLKLKHSLEVEGLENLVEGGPFVFTPNHSSHFDLLSVAGSIPHRFVHRTFAVAAKDYFFNKTFKAIGARAFVNAIPFDRKGRVNESMQHCREALAEGDSLVIFPEGTRSPSGELQEFKAGVGQLLAGNPAARAVPVFIDGAYKIMPKGSKGPGPGKLKVRFGRPVSFRDLPMEAESYRKISERLRAEVVDLSRGRLH